MKDDTTIIPFHQLDSISDPLTEIAREGARRMLAVALKAEADAFVASFADEILADGRRRMVMHGHGANEPFRRGSARSPFSARKRATRRAICPVKAKCA